MEKSDCHHKKGTIVCILRFSSIPFFRKTSVKIIPNINNIAKIAKKLRHVPPFHKPQFFIITLCV